MKRELGDGFELDDDPGRIDREAVHRYLSEGAYWARGRPREVQDALIDGVARIVGLYREGEQIGFSRTVSDRQTQAYLADVYVLEEHRGRGLGVELVRFTVDEGPFAGTVDPAYGRCARAVSEVRVLGARRADARTPALRRSAASTPVRAARGRPRGRPRSDAVLGERVAVADGDRVVLVRLLVDRERERRAELVLAAVAAADLARVVVLGDDDTS